MTKDVIPELELMRQGISYKFPVRLRAFSCMLRPLSISEESKVISEVIDILKQLPESQRNELKESELIAKKKLELASTTSETTYDPKLTNLIMSNMNPDELHYLFKQYREGLVLCDPALESLPKETIEQLVEHVKKNPSALIERSTWELVNMVRFLLETKVELPTDK